MTELKSVLISGCSSGIGRRVATGLAAQGYRVFATARGSSDVDMLRASGLESVRLDLDDSDSIDGAVAEILSRTGDRLFGLVNNGAYGQPGAVEDLSREALRRQFETNVLGTQELTNRVIPVMRRQGYGRIVQISSVLGFVCLPYRGAYNASKFALEALSDTLRLELRGTNIHVSLVEPGPIRSRFRANAYRAFQAYIDADASAHGDAYRHVEKRLLDPSDARFTLPETAVLTRVQHALAATHPRIRYRVTLPTHMFAILKRILPDRWMDSILGRSIAHELPPKARQ